MELLTLTGVSKSYGNTVAVRDLELSVRAGEIVGLIGPNGAGKSSTLGMILGLIRADAGAIDVCGVDPQEDGRTARDIIGCVPDEDALLPNLTAREHLEFVGLLHSVPRTTIEARTSLLVDLLDLTQFVDHTPEAFSFGMRKKLQLACALIHEPELLILDEPLNGLDAETTAVVRSILEYRRHQELSTLLATHNLSFAERICDRVYILIGGELRAHGDVGAVLAHVEAPDLEAAFLKLAVSEERRNEVLNLLARV